MSERRSYLVTGATFAAGRSLPDSNLWAELKR